MEKFTNPNSDNTQPEGGPKRESPFERMNRERALKEFQPIKSKIEELNALHEQRNDGAEGLDSDIQSLTLSIKSSVKEFLSRNPTSPLSGALKKATGLE